MGSTGSLAGRHVLVTGAARGIGAEIARRLAREGAALTLLGRNRDLLARLAAELPGTGHGAVQADVADAPAIAAAFGQARAARGPISILVNNAGQAESAPFLKTSSELWQRMIAVNLTGSFHCAQAALPDMLSAQWGRIVNIASTAGQRGYAYVAAYTAAKHGVIGLTRSLALEVAARGVTVNAVCPGYTDTDIVRQSIARIVDKTGRTNEQARAEFIKSNPQGRLVEPEEVADAVAWLCGESARSVTGQSISVSGGEVT
ncbi:MAG TPA: SDR family NAD(P)-dependent oxidoreductase [Burkholderiaceae bacterium]